MRLTTRGYLAAGLTVGLCSMLGGTMAGENTPSTKHHKPPVVIYEDGSGVQYDGDREVRTFPEGTFVWNCHTMGNRRCGRPEPS